MSNWIATNELRYVERYEVDSDAVTGETFEWFERTLQQKWLKPSDYSYFDVAIDDEYFTEEWRDIPVVEEER